MIIKSSSYHWIEQKVGDLPIFPCLEIFEWSFRLESKRIRQLYDGRSLNVVDLAGSHLSFRGDVHTNRFEKIVRIGHIDQIRSGWQIVDLKTSVGSKIVIRTKREIKGKVNTKNQSINQSKTNIVIKTHFKNPKYSPWLTRMRVTTCQSLVKGNSPGTITRPSILL